MVREVRIDVIRIFAVVLAGGLCMLPVSGLANGPDISNGPGSLNPGDPDGGDRFYEGIPSGGGGSGDSIGDNSSPGDSDTRSEPQDSVVLVPVMWPPTDGWLIQIPDIKLQLMTKINDIRSFPERH